MAADITGSPITRRVSRGGVKGGNQRKGLGLSATYLVGDVPVNVGEAAVGWETVLTHLDGARSGYKAADGRGAALSEDAEQSAAVDADLRALG